MKKTLFSTLCILTTSLFIGCGSSGVEDDTKKDIILKKGESIICTKETQFSVNPTDKPLVNFTKNIENGEITIAINKESKGFVTIEGCTKK